MGIRTEIKNIGSVRGVANAIEYEIQRQIKIKENGGEIINETRSWDAVNKATVGMRDKERQQVLLIKFVNRSLKTLKNLF